MIFPEKQVQLKDGRTAVLRGPTIDDAAMLLDYLKVTSGETPFLIRYPEECTETMEQEIAFLKRSIDSATNMMILCMVDGKLAGNCALSRHDRIKTRHRADVAIALKKEFWGLGIGAIMFDEMITSAKNLGISQLELEVIDGNQRAMGLYQKMGFEIVATHPNAICLKDGAMLSEHVMVKKL